MSQAHDLTDAVKAAAMLRALADQLHRNHQDAARSFLEGLEEALGLGIECSA